MNQTPGSGVCMCMYVQVHVYALVYICVRIVWLSFQVDLLINGDCYFYGK